MGSNHPKVLVFLVSSHCSKIFLCLLKQSPKATWPQAAHETLQTRCAGEGEEHVLGADFSSCTLSTSWPLWWSCSTSGVILIQMGCLSWFPASRSDCSGKIKWKTMSGGSLNAAAAETCTNTASSTHHCSPSPPETSRQSSFIAQPEQGGEKTRAIKAETTLRQRKTQKNQCLQSLQC